MICIYGIKNCATMKKAFDKLDSLGVSYQFFDYKKQLLDKSTLKGWVDNAGIDKILNKKGTTWRKLDDKIKSNCDSDIDFAIDTLINNPSMIKRPIVVANDMLIIGFDEQSFDKIITKIITDN